VRVEAEHIQHPQARIDKVDIERCTKKRILLTQNADHLAQILSGSKGVRNDERRRLAFSMTPSILRGSC
jgi:hypothetical protein